MTQSMWKSVSDRKDQQAKMKRKNYTNNVLLTLLI